MNKVRDSFRARYYKVAQTPKHGVRLGISIPGGREKERRTKGEFCFEIFVKGWNDDQVQQFNDSLRKKPAAKKPPPQTNKEPIEKVSVACVPKTPQPQEHEGEEINEKDQSTKATAAEFSPFSTINPDESPPKNRILKTNMSTTLQVNYREQIEELQRKLASVTKDNKYMLQKLKESSEGTEKLNTDNAKKAAQKVIASGKKKSQILQKLAKEKRSKN